MTTIQLTAWPLPYGATAALLCLGYVPFAWAFRRWARKFSKLECYDGLVPLYVLLMIAMIAAAVLYGFIPGFYFRLSLKDVNWAYLDQ